MRGTSLSSRELRGVLPRPRVDIDAVIETVSPLLLEVRTRGHRALDELSLRFDGVVPPTVRVPQEELRRASDGLDPAVRDALLEAISRVRRVHRAQLPQDHVTILEEGAQVTQRWIPIARAGLYVPGGQAVYPSSVIMNVVPCQEAGVTSLAVASPPQKEFGGLPHPTILGACHLLGVTEVYAIGGAQAIAAFAYGVGAGEASREVEIDPVDVITGPGNVYVAAAKRLVRGVTGIDAEAGPTEIAILADQDADAELVAADMVSQAEHDDLACAVLVTESPDLARRAADAAWRRIDEVTNIDPEHTERTRARLRRSLSGNQSAVIVVDSVERGIDLVNAYGAEHLEIMTRDAPHVASKITNAGAVFVGPYSPVSVGDYIAGSNHVLPTGGTARFASGLGVHSFLKSMEVVTYASSALARVGRYAVALARDEQLPAHAEAILARTEGGGAL